MKVEIDKAGFIRITAETIEEAFALKYVMKDHRGESKVIVDCSILTDKDNDKIY